jgi:hypothetical protein
MSLLALFQWLAGTPAGVFMQQSSWAFAAAEMIHLLSLAILGGAIFIINLRTFGAGLKNQSVAHLASELRPFVVMSLLGSVLSGVLLVSAESEKCYYNSAFRWKMLFLALAVIFYFGVQQRLFKRENVSNLTGKAAGFVSITLWLAVGLAGRAIGII